MWCDVCWAQLCKCAQSVKQVDRWANQELGDVVTGVQVAYDAEREAVLRQRRHMQAAMWQALADETADAELAPRPPKLLEDLEAEEGDAED